MGSVRTRRALSIAVTTIVTMAMAACTHMQQQATKVTKPVDAAQVKAAFDKRQLAILKQQLKQAQQKVAQDQKALPGLMADSDNSLKQAQILKNQADAAKDKNSRQSIHKKADAAQMAADAKAQQLLNTREDLDARLADISRLQKQINEKSGIKNPPEKVASSTAHGKHHLKQLADAHAPADQKAAPSKSIAGSTKDSHM